MRYFIYNLLMYIFFIIYSPVLLIKIFFDKNYEHISSIRRLGVIDDSFREYIKDAKSKEKRLIWFHAGSVGELQIAKKLIDGLIKKKEDISFVVTTSGRSGWQMAEELFANNSTIIPFDLPFIMKRFIRFVNPCLVVMVEPDILPNFIKYADKYSKIILLNAWFGEKNKGQFKYIPDFFEDIIKRFKFISLKDESYLNELSDRVQSNVGIKVSGDLKFTQDFQTPDSDFKLNNYKNFTDHENRKILVAGSTHPGEELIILDTFKRIKKRIPELLLIIAPRHLERIDELMKIVSKAGYQPILKTEINNYNNLNDCVILLNTMGELKNIYSLATAVFIGGTLVNKGGHNLLEPVMYGKPVLFGPYIKNVKDTADILLKNGIGIKVSDREDLLKELLKIINDESSRRKIRDSSRKVLSIQSDILEENIKFILNWSI